MKKILVLIDIQKDFVDGALGTKEALAMIPAAAEKILSFDGEVFATFDTHYEDYMQTAEGKKLPVPHCIKATPGHALNADIEAALSGKHYTAVEKNTFGSVELPDLIQKAANGEAFSIEIIGLCTDICVISNALILKAHFPEVPISVDAACCAGVTPELHKAALAAMKSCQIDIVNE
ncbi:MAG: cysteine hydrolase [Ruminiclostridium sp.]|nr:cysteine hydrolase [Ruminiclostridium sp.]